MIIVFEQAKNENVTCKFEISKGKYKYMYSKYVPERVKIERILPDTKVLILAGGGMGYEYDQYRQLFNGQIYVLELSDVLRRKLSELYPQMQFIDENEFINYMKDPYVQLIEHIHVLELYANDYMKLKASALKNNTIAILAHNSIQKDCVRAFRDANYEPVELTWTNEATLKREMINLNPLFIFSVNFSIILSEISKELAIPYVSWTVDTPAYSLYNVTHFHEHTYTFIYDEEIVDFLKQAGCQQVYYLPVAAPVKRYEEVVLSNQDVDKYSCDISFLGSRCSNNEMKQHFQHILSKGLWMNIDEMVEAQCFISNSAIKDSITEKFCLQFETETGYNLLKDSEPLLSKIDRLGYLIGRYHSYVERTALMNAVRKLGKTHIYGESSWGEDFSADIYKGLAENDVEMPKVFKASKININNIRSFVESGLPQRVFDVLACKGFLITNEKSDLTRYFEDGKHLVIYRDEQHLKQLITYYLEHEEERKKIAHAGYLHVKEHHTFNHRIRMILETLSL